MRAFFFKSIIINDMDNMKLNLTQREEEVLGLIMQGYSNTAMAKILSISVHTIKAHVESIYRKFGVHNKVQAVIFAVMNDLVDISNELPFVK